MITSIDFKVLFAMSVLILITASRVGGAETTFVSRSVKIGAVEYRYQVFVPANWKKGKKSPVILFLHGAGERGDDNEAQARVGFGSALKRDAQKFPAVVVLPQCPRSRWWSEPEMLEMAMKALDQTMSEFSGDPRRVYLTGLSMGGYGTWAMAAAHPNKFAALAVVCGGIRPPRGMPNPARTEAAPTDDPYAAAAAKIGKTPTWVFHGGADPVVPVSESRKMVEALKAAGGNVLYSEYEGVTHNSWDRAYAEPELLPWLLSHHQKEAASERTRYLTSDLHSRFRKVRQSEV